MDIVYINKVIEELKNTEFIIDKFNKSFKEKYPTLTYRIVHKDGIDYVITCDFRTDRLNISINNGIISDIDVG